MRLPPPAKKRKNKYGAVKTEVDGIVFHSKKEAGRYRELNLLLKAGEIRALQLQVKYPVEINGKKIFTYNADFVYVQKGAEIVEDVKGFRDAVYKLKKKAVEAYYGIEILET